MTALKIGERVQFTDAAGKVIRGRVRRLYGHGVGVVFQSGWTWPDGSKEPRSDYAWHFPPCMTLNGEKTLVLSRQTEAAK